MIKQNYIFHTGLLVLAGASVFCIIYSPVLGSRLMIYFVYFIGVLLLSLSKCLVISKKKHLIITIILLLLLLTLSCKYYQIYHYVGNQQKKRESIIQYYLDNPEEKDIWIPRFKDGYLHTADIDEDNIAHMRFFKKYYGLSEDTIIHFYFE